MEIRGSALISSASRYRRGISFSRKSARFPVSDWASATPPWRRQSNSTGTVEHLQRGGLPRGSRSEVHRWCTARHQGRLIKDFLMLMTFSSLHPKVRVKRTFSTYSFHQGDGLILRCSNRRVLPEMKREPHLSGCWRGRAGTGRISGILQTERHEGDGRMQNRSAALVIDHGSKPWLWPAPHSGATSARSGSESGSLSVSQSNPYCDFESRLRLRPRCRSQYRSHSAHVRAPEQHMRLAGPAEPFRVARPEAVALG